MGIRGMFVSKLAMLMSRSCMLLGFVVLAECVVMLGLMVMMRRGVMVSGRLMMMLMRWMLRHLNFSFSLNSTPPIRTLAATESSTGFWKKSGP
jgi:hypothetical protein